MDLLSWEQGEYWKALSTDTQFYIEVLFDCTSACFPLELLENFGTCKVINNKTQILNEYGLKRFYKAVGVQWYSDEILQTTENNCCPFWQDPEGTDGSDCPSPASAAPGPRDPARAIIPCPSASQQELSPAHHSPALPTHGICCAGLSAHSGLIPSPGRCPLLRMGAALGVPRCSAHGWTGLGQGCLMEIPMEAHREPQGCLRLWSGAMQMLSVSGFRFYVAPSLCWYLFVCIYSLTVWWTEIYLPKAREKMCLCEGNCFSP